MSLLESPVTHSLMMVIMCVLVSLFLISTGGSGHPQNHVLIINGGADDPLGLDAALHLIEEEDDQVTVAGNFKHLHAKIKAKKIIEKGGAVYDGNGCDEELMKYLIANMTGVVYLTSGRGGDDKASLDQRIYQYVEEHMKCFIGLLEILKDFKNIPLVYESYARNRVNDNQQDSLSLSIFTAVKKSMEDFAESYCQKYGVMAIGIRPMNHYSLSSDSLDKQSNEEHQLCKLYATYMRDVIDGIREAIEKPYLCGQVYELGGAKPVTMDTANLLHDQNKFILEQMELYQNGNLGSIENITIDYKLRDRLKRKAIERKGELFIKRKRNIRMKYEEYAVKNDIHVARFYNNKIFKFYPNVDSGRDERKLNLPVRELKRICGRIDECVAFTSDGRMKSIIERKEKWKMVASGGLYIADIDVCQNGLHNCYGNSTCHYRGPGQFECRCAKGWSFTSQSPPTCQQSEYIEGLKSEKEMNDEFTDKVNGKLWREEMTNNTIIYKGYTLIGTVILAYPDASGNIDKLMDACIRTYGCEGFSSRDNNLMKNIILIKESSSVAFVRKKNY